jgi:hypothetical protein
LPTTNPHVMNTSPDSRRGAKHAALVAVLLFLVCVVAVWLAQGPRVTPATAIAPRPSLLVVTQLVVGGPLVLASQAPGGSLVIVTQFPTPTLTIQSPPEFYIQGRRVSETEFNSQTRPPGDGVGMTLLDTHAEARPIDLK